MTNLRLAIVTILLCLPLFARTADLEGVLVLAHGSVLDHFTDYPRDKSQCELIHEHISSNTAPHQWESAICMVVDEVHKTKKAPVPVEVAFGMTNLESFQHAVDRLSAAGITRLRLVPLYVNSQSDVIRTQRYMFGIDNVAGLKGDRVMIPKSVTKIIYENALDQSEELTDVLLRRSQELTVRPFEEELILVGHGPVKDSDDSVWVRDFNVHAERIQSTLAKSGRQFARVQSITLQDDASEEVRKAKTLALRRMVTEATKVGRKVLILPVLIASGGIENDLLMRLRGLNFAYVGHMICPDPAISQWIVKKVNGQ